ncbi:MAG: hypothetical protein WBD48_15475, partial [Pseudolabrys sp.]
LPQDIRDIVTKASLEGRKAAMDDSDKRLRTALGELKSGGVKVSEPDLKPFVNAAEQTRSWFVEKFGNENVAAMVKAAG